MLQDTSNDTHMQIRLSTLCITLQHTATHGNTLTRRQALLLVCCRVLPCVAVCCSVLQCVAVCCRAPQLQSHSPHVRNISCKCALQCVASVASVAVCCSVLQCVAVCCNRNHNRRKRAMPSASASQAFVRCVLQCVAVCCSVLQRVAACCSVL